MCTHKLEVAPLKKVSVQRLESWLLFRRTQPAWQLTTMYNSSSRDPTLLASQALCACGAQMHSGKIPKHIKIRNNSNFFFKKGKEKGQYTHHHYFSMDPRKRGSLFL